MDDVKAKKQKYLRNYKRRPENKAKIKAYACRPEVASRRRELRSSPEYKARRKEQRAAKRAQTREYNQKHYYSPGNRPMLLLIRAKSRAKRLGYEFNILVPDVRKIMTDACPYTGVAFDYRPPENGLWRNPWAPSLDRIDSTRGYVPGNIEIVSTWWNSAKSEWTPEIMRTALGGLLKSAKF